MNEDVRIVKLLVNNDDAKKKLDELEQKKEGLKAGLENAIKVGDSRKIDEYSKALSKTERELKRMQSRAVSVRNVINNLNGSSVNELKNALKEMTRELNSGKIKRGSKEWDVLTSSIKRTREELSKIKKETDASADMIGKLRNVGEKFVSMSASVAAAVAAISGIRSTVRQTVDDYAKMDEALSQVIKYTGMTKEQVADLNESFKQMDTRTSRERLNELAGDAGRLGITAKEDILAFVSAADQINVALGADLGEDAVKNIGKLTQLFGEDKRLGLKEGMLATGSAINELAQNSSAAEPYILDFTGRLSGAAAQAKISQADIMGLASVLDQNMVTSEKGATALQKVIIKMYQEPQKIAKAAGLDVAQFSALLKKDANAALIQFMESLSKMGSLDKLAPLFGDLQMSGAAIVEVLSAFAGNIENVRTQQAIANKAFNEAVSITNEFNVQNNTVQAGLDKAKKKFHDISVALGEELMPIASHMVSLTSLTTKAFYNLVKTLKNNVPAIIAVTSSLAAYVVVVNLSIIRTKLMVVWHGIITAKMYAQATATKLLAAVTSLLSGNVRNATRYMKLFFAAIRVNPVGLLAAAVAALITLLITLNKKNKELTASQKAIQSASQKANEEYANQTSEVQRLIKAIDSEGVSQKQRIEYMKQLKTATGLTNIELDEQNRLTKESKKALDEWLKLKMKSIAIDAYKDELTGLYKQRRSDEKAVRDASYRNAKAWEPKTGRSFALGLLEAEDIEEKAEHRQAVLQLEKAEAKLQQTNDAISALEAEILKMETSLIESTVSGGTTGGVTPPGDLDEKHKLRIKQLEAHAEEGRAALAAQYSAGIIDYREYTDSLAQIDVDLYKAQLDLFDAKSEEWYNQQSKYLTALKALKKNYSYWSLNELEAEIEQEKRSLFERYASGLIDEKAYRSQLNDLQLKYLSEKALLLRQDSTPEAANAAEIEYQKESIMQKQAKEEEFLKSVNEMRKKYIGMSAAEQMQQELALLDEMHERKLLSEEDYQRMKYQIETRGKDSIEKETTQSATSTLKKAGYERVDAPSGGDSITNGFMQLTAAAANISNAKAAYAKLDELRKSDLISQAEYDAAAAELDKQRFTNFQQCAQAAYSTVSALMSSYSAYSQACIDAEVSKVEQRYDAEIAAAGSNSARGKRLEEQKQKEINRIKAREAKKQATIQIAQALATTAMNALQAYGCMLALGIPAGPVLAPIAAATATAAGMLQVATIKKQAEAQSNGYYRGGFTGGDNYHDTAGIVHEGEFVANHEAVNNPNVLPVLRLIDQAQRNNTIGSLTAADVSRAISAPSSAAAVYAAGGTTTTVTQDSPDLDVLDRLARRLDEPIVAHVALDEFDLAHRHYETLKKRK